MQVPGNSYENTAHVFLAIASVIETLKWKNVHTNLILSQALMTDFANDKQ